MPIVEYTFGQFSRSPSLCALSWRYGFLVWRCFSARLSVLSHYVLVFRCTWDTFWPSNLAIFIGRQSQSIHWNIRLYVTQSIENTHMKCFGKICILVFVLWCACSRFVSSIVKESIAFTRNCNIHITRRFKPKSGKKAKTSKQSQCENDGTRIELTADSQFWSIIFRFVCSEVWS